MYTEWKHERWLKMDRKEWTDRLKNGTSRSSRKFESSVETWFAESWESWESWESEFASVGGGAVWRQNSRDPASNTRMTEWGHQAGSIAVFTRYCRPSLFASTFEITNYFLCYLLLLLLKVLGFYFTTTFSFENLIRSTTKYKLILYICGDALYTENWFTLLRICTVLDKYSKRNPY